MKTNLKLIQNIVCLGFLFIEILLLFLTWSGFFYPIIDEYMLLNMIIILNIIVFYLYFVVCQYLKNKALTEVKTDLLKKQLEIQKEYNLIIEENNKIYNTIKNNILTQLNQQEYDDSIRNLNKTDIGRLIEQESQLHDVHYCNNKIIDAIMYNKILICRKMHITVYTEIVVPEHITVDDIDLISIYTNLFDNAIEACTKLHDNEKQIEIRSRIIHDYLVITIENSYDPQTLKDDFSTTKKDTHHHGIGTKIIKMITKKYHGQLTVKKTDHSIEFQITLQLPD